MIKNPTGSSEKKIGRKIQTLKMGKPTDSGIQNENAFFLAVFEKNEFCVKRIWIEVGLSQNVYVLKTTG